MDPWAVLEQSLACHKQGNLVQAEALYRQLLSTFPEHGVVNHLMGVLRAQQGRHDEAVPFFETSLKDKPGDPAVLLDAGNNLQKLGRLDEALGAFTAALAARPGFFEAINNRGNIFLEIKQLDQALDCFDQALAIRPDAFETQFNRGLVLHQMRRFSEAVTVFDRLLAQNARHPKLFGEALLSALNACDWDRTARYAAEIPARIAQGTPIQPLTLMTVSSDPALLLACARNTAASLKPPAPTPLWRGERYGHDRIRLAYLSSDFRTHPVAQQVVQVLENHDRERFEIIGIANGLDDGSALRARMIGAVDEFHDLRALPPRQIAETIRALEADLVVDLNGLTEGTALAALAFRPAPVQATWLGYAGTTGADFVDYLIADAIVAPPSQQAFYAEKLVHLPHSFLPLDTTRPLVPPPSRAQAGLPDEAFVFCCFNNSWKIIPPVFDVWMRVLHQVPRSVLWLKDYGQTSAQALRAQAAARGIAPARLVFAPNVALDEHLARHQLADLFLDTWHYGAHATAADALWAGLPVLTCLGEVFPGRVAASLVTAAGLPELTTSNAGEYEAAAVALARDPLRLKAIRDKLAANRTAAPLFDTARFTRDLEAAYQSMLQEKIT